MKKSIIALLLIIFFVAICAITCPGKQDHKEAVVSLVNHKIRKDLSKSGAAGCFALLGSMIGSTISETTIENMLEVKDCFIFSLGQLYTNDGVTTVSVGVLGHVFTASNETFSKAMDECNDLFD